MKSIRDRFSEKYIEEPNSGCWLWTGAINNSGYGKMKINNKSVGAHRISYQIHNNENIDGLDVCHRCDNRLCVNPSHLFSGTRSENIKDAVIKGRHIAKRGEDSGRSKLTNDEVLEIRNSTKSNRKLASMYGVSSTVIFDIKHRKTWRHI